MATLAGTALWEGLQAALADLVRSAWAFWSKMTSSAWPSLGSAKADHPGLDSQEHSSSHCLDYINWPGQPALGPCTTVSRAGRVDFSFRSTGLQGRLAPQHPCSRPDGGSDPESPRPEVAHLTGKAA